MNATNIDRTTDTTDTATAAIEVFGMSFNSAEHALCEFDFTDETGEILPAIWHQDAKYWQQPVTVREIHGEAVLVRDLNLPGFSMLDDEKLVNFYLVEGSTLHGTQRLYALRFDPQEAGPAIETWTELGEGTVRTPYATDDDGDTRRVILARLEDGRLFVKVTSQEAARAWMLFADKVISEARKSAALDALQF